MLMPWHTAGEDRGVGVWGARATDHGGPSVVWHAAPHCRHHHWLAAINALPAGMYGRAWRVGAAPSEKQLQRIAVLYELPMSLVARALCREQLPWAHGIFLFRMQLAQFEIVRNMLKATAERTRVLAFFGVALTLNKYRPKMYYVCERKNSITEELVETKVCCGLLTREVLAQAYLDACVCII